MLDQAVFARLRGAKRVLLAGCGGGYDVLGAVPLRTELRRAGVTSTLASLSFAYLNGLDGARQDLRLPNLYEVDRDAATPRAYCPEAHLAAHLGEPIHCFDKTGVR